MKRMHVMLKVKDLDESLRFYAELFGAEPSVRKPDYAKWMLEDPRVNFSIGVAAGGESPGIEHLGIQAESRDELDQVRARIGRIALAGGVAAIDDEGETTCCYANSDKTWVTDAQGVSWEAFYTHGASATFGPAAGAAANAETSASCCVPASAGAAGCCAPRAAAGGGAG